MVNISCKYCDRELTSITTNIPSSYIKKERAEAAEKGLTLASPVEKQLINWRSCYPCDRVIFVGKM